jgi:predicted deacylase
MADGELALRGQRFERGSRTVVPLSAVELADGTAIEVKVIVLRGAEPGPVFYIGSGVHGDETGTVVVTAKLSQMVEAGSLRGTLLIVPVQSPLAFQGHHRLPLPLLLKSPHDQGAANIFQAYPGNPEGNATERMASMLSQELMSQAEYVVDLHTPTTGGRYLPFAFVPPPRFGEVAERSWELVRAFGAGAVLDNEASTYVSPATPHVVAAQRGAAAFGVELGEGGRVEREWVEHGVRGLLNVLRRVGMVAGAVEARAEPVHLRSLVPVRVRRGGLVEQQVALGGWVQAGQLVTTITSITGEVVEEVHAPCDGLLLRIATFPAVATGEQVVQLGVPV